GAAPAAVVPADAKAAAFVAALGGRANLRSIDACATRLRLGVADATAIDEARLRSLGARGVLRPSGTSVQVIVGGIADALAMDMRAALDAGDAADASGGAAPVAAAPNPAAESVDLSPTLQAALGGGGNVASASRHGTRLRIVVTDRNRVDAAALATQGRAVAWAAPDTLHLLT
ncbi:glucose PTS transporter subunit EIIB, partial [Sphingomonas aquatilis]